MPNRRSVLVAAALAAGSALTSRWLSAADATANPATASTKRRNAFHAALSEQPQLLGWASASTDRLDASNLRLEGTLPADLRGTLWRNGPGIHERFGERYRHWFDGDGWLHEYRFSGTAVNYRGRVLQTPKRARESAAGRRLYMAFDTPMPSNGLPVRRPDEMNVANISVLPHHGELLALWEAGSASIINPDTLAWQGFKTWRKDMQGMPFTAHPKVDTDGTLWAIGYFIGQRPQLVLYHIGADGRLIKTASVPVDPLGMVHDFVITQKHLVIVIPPFVVAPGRGDTFLSSHVWRPQLGSRVLVVARNDFNNRRWYQLPPGFGFHHGNAWEDGDGTITFDHCVAADASLVTDGLRTIMEGGISPINTAYHTTFVLRPDGSSDIRHRGIAAEFPVVSPRITGKRNQFVYLISNADPATEWTFNALVKYDLESGQQTRFDYGHGLLAEEHIFVPKPQAKTEDDGYVVGVVLDYQQPASAVVVFDARHIEQGPVARAWLPWPLPLALHGKFLAT